MTIVKQRFTEDKKYSEIEITGHSGYGIAGKDPICGAVSILAYSLVQYIEFMENAKKLKKVKIEETAGRLYLKIRISPEHLSEFITCQNTIFTGCLLLSQWYPENVELDTEVFDDI